MKRLVSLFLLLSVVLFQPLWSSSLSNSEIEELAQIVQELKNLNEEQEQIIERSQTRNEELERLSSEQEKQIETLTELSESRQKIINEQKQTIDALKSSSKEQKKSSVKGTISHILSIVASFFLGCFAGFMFL